MLSTRGFSRKILCYLLFVVVAVDLLSRNSDPFEFLSLDSSSDNPGQVTHLSTNRPQLRPEENSLFIPGQEYNSPSAPVIKIKVEAGPIAQDATTGQKYVTYTLTPDRTDPKAKQIIEASDLSCLADCPQTVSVAPGGDALKTLREHIVDILKKTTAPVAAPVVAKGATASKDTSDPRTALLEKDIRDCKYTEDSTVSDKTALRGFDKVECYAERLIEMADNTCSDVSDRNSDRQERKCKRKLLEIYDRGIRPTLESLAGSKNEDKREQALELIRHLEDELPGEIGSDRSSGRTLRCDDDDDDSCLTRPIHNSLARIALKIENKDRLEERLASAKDLRETFSDAFDRGDPYDYQNALGQRQKFLYEMQTDMRPELSRLVRSGVLSPYEADRMLRNDPDQRELQDLLANMALPQTIGRTYDRDYRSGGNDSVYDEYGRRFHDDDRYSYRDGYQDDYRGGDPRSWGTRGFDQGRRSPVPPRPNARQQSGGGQRPYLPSQSFYGRQQQLPRYNGYPSYTGSGYRQTPSYRPSYRPGAGPSASGYPASSASSASSGYSGYPNSYPRFPTGAAYFRPSPYGSSLATSPAIGGSSRG